MLKQRRFYYWIFFITVLLLYDYSENLSSSLYVFAENGSSNINHAELLINQAFISVLDAEKVGANVTDLLAQLNYALGLLAHAENSYRAGDVNTAEAQVDNIISISQRVTFEAQNAKQVAIVSGQYTFWFTITLTVIGILVLVLVLFLFWRLFKRNYIRELSEAKPELVSYESIK